MFDLNSLKWTGQPKEYEIRDNYIKIVTAPETDLWQRTYYGFRNDNSPVLQKTISEKSFSFEVKTRFDTKVLYDQCGICMYFDEDSWFKASVELDNDNIQRLGSVLTTRGYSDWASTEIAIDIKEVWYRLSRKEDDFAIEYSFDGDHYQLMRVFHFEAAKDDIPLGVYACSPKKSSFTAEFTEFEFGQCKFVV